MDLVSSRDGTGRILSLSPGSLGRSKLEFRHLCPCAQLGGILHPASCQWHPLIYERAEQLPGRETCIHDQVQTHTGMHGRALWREELDGEALMGFVLRARDPV